MVGCAGAGLFEGPKGKIPAGEKAGKAWLKGKIFKLEGREIMRGMKAFIGLVSIVVIMAAGARSEEFTANKLWVNGNRWFRVGNLDEAIISYTKALEVDPEYVEAYNNRGQAYYQKNDFESAIKDYTRAIEIKPDDPRYYNNRGNAYKDSGQLEKALADFNKAIELDKDYNTVYYNRCDLYHDLDKLELALADCDKACELMPATDMVWLRRGLLHLEMKNLDLAEKDFTKAISLQGRNIKELYKQRARVMEEKGEWAKAVSDLEESLMFDRRDAEALARLAWLLATVPDEKVRDGKRAKEKAESAVKLTEEKNIKSLESLAAAYA
jgi:tetratricopeptide (TPR) repeat protein